MFSFKSYLWCNHFQLIKLYIDLLSKVRGALETLVSALTPIAHAKLRANEVQPALMNTDLLSRDGQSISLLLSLFVRLLILIFFTSGNEFLIFFGL